MGAEVTPRWVCAVALAALIGTSGLADAAAAQSRLEPTASDYGGVGLMQTRTARFHDDGDLSVGYFHGFPWTRFMVNFQALPWLEVTARYGDFNSGTSSTLADRDRSVDAKILLWPESDLLPQVAVGFQDFMGTGHYSGEYLVASKRWFDLDFTFGVGWGRLGSRGDLDNPLSLLSKRFDRRSDSGGGGGLLSLDWFQGRDIAIFGGIEYHTPIDGLSLKLELSGDDMPLERNNPEFSLESRLNVGASYRISDWADLGVSFENGNTVMLRGLVGLNLGKKPMPIVIDQPPPAVKPRVEQSGPRPIGTVRAEARAASGASQPAAPPRHEADRADEQAALALIAALREARLPPLAAEVRTREATAIVAHERYRHLTKLIGRVARVMATVLPPTVERFTIAVWTGGLEVSRVALFRGDVERAASYSGSPEETWMHTMILSPEGSLPPSFVDAGTYPRFTWGLEPKLRQQFMDPADAFRYQLWAALSGHVELFRGFSVTGTLGKSLYGNLDEIKAAPASDLPHVRTDIAKYLKEGSESLERLQADYLFNLAPDWYGRVSGGLFEPMFGGIGGEVLYRPQGRRWALGLELNHVRQRDYNQMLDFRDYEVTTGHLSAYYALPFYDLNAAVHAGRYLAGDWGATFELSRRFPTGVEVGAFATLTNVPFEKFGEGSFDKGVFISIPLDMFLPYPTTSVGSIVLHSLTRDGGQRLAIGNRLYGVTEAGNSRLIKESWNRIFE